MSLSPAELAYEEQSILHRLALHETIYCARWASIAAAQDMQRRGLVECQRGEGRDEGLLLVRKATTTRVPRGGGAA